MNLHLRILAATSLALFMSACGGGGGGGSSSGGESFSVDRTQLNFASPSNGTTAPTATVTGRISGSPSAVYLYIEHSGGVIQGVTSPDLHGSSGTSTVIMASPASVAPGDYAGSITVRACRDPSCNSQFSGSPRTIAVRYVVGMPVDPSSIRIEGIEGVATAPQSVAFSHYAGSVAWSTSVQDTGWGTSWVQVTPASGSGTPATTNVSFAAQSIGDYHADVRLSAGR